MDAYGKSLPTFNIKGKDRVNTILGGFLSIILYMIIFMYSMFKFTHMVTHENPNITGYDIEDGLSETEVNLNEHNFRMAFTIESFQYPLQQKNDPKYVKYIVRMYGKRDGEYYQRILPYHKCTDEDFKGFYPVKKQSTSALQAIR